MGSASRHNVSNRGTHKAGNSRQRREKDPFFPHLKKDDSTGAGVEIRPAHFPRDGINTLGMHSIAFPERQDV
jgi:hypothetical protein